LKTQAEGHADAIGTDRYNQRLSERRAARCATFLVQQSITPEVITAAGFGESRPVATNETAVGRQQNRRVELVVSGEPIGTTGQDVGTPHPNVRHQIAGDSGTRRQALHLRAQLPMTRRWQMKIAGYAIRFSSAEEIKAVTESHDVKSRISLFVP
jgi:hypothetical protein